MAFSNPHIDRLLNEVMLPEDATKPRVLVFITEPDRVFSFEIDAADQVVADVIPNVRPWIDVHEEDYLTAFPEPGLPTGEISVRGAVTKYTITAKTDETPAPKQQIVYTGRLTQMHKMGTINDITWYEVFLTVERDLYHDKIGFLLPFTMGEAVAIPTGAKITVTVDIEAP